MVYRARFVKNDRIVAVKLLPESITDKTVLARFEREMELLKTLRHPNIVHTFGGVCEGDRRFYAMEYVAGGTLDDILAERGRLSAEAVTRYALQMLSGLAFAHERHIVHRDVKPANFLIGKNGQLKLADFGLATVRDEAKLTAAGRTMGTFRYMAPEQIRGRPDPCPQTDLYALGVVLFELLTGEPPFKGETPAETLQKHLKAPVPRVSGRILRVPPGLDSLVFDLMQKRIEDRPASAVEAGRRLKGVDEEVVVVDRKTTRIAPGGTSREEQARPAAVAEDAADSPAAATPAAGPTRWAAVAALVLLAAAVWWGGSLAERAAGLDRIERHWVQRFAADQPVPTRVDAAEHLGLIGSDGDAAYGTLYAALEDPDAQVRAAAAAALGGHVAQKGTLIPTLTKIQREDADSAVRNAAASSVRQLGEADPPGGGWLGPLAAFTLLAAAGWFAWRG